MKNLKELTNDELSEERHKRLAEVVSLDKVEFDRRHRELFFKLWGNIHKIDAELSKRKELNHRS